MFQPKDVLLPCNVGMQSSWMQLCRAARAPALGVSDSSSVRRSLPYLQNARQIPRTMLCKISAKVKEFCYSYVPRALLDDRVMLGLLYVWV